MNIETYLDCIADDEKRVPIANEPGDGDDCFRFYFGAYGSTLLDVFADHLEDALEQAFEWLDDNAPGHLVNVGETELKESAEELGYDYAQAVQSAQDGIEDETLEAIREHAEQDLTQCSHTTLKHGQYLLSWEWGVSELRPPPKLKAIAR